MTKFLKKDQLTSSWYEIDATNAVVGRLATVISKIIRGKNKTTFTPHMDLIERHLKQQNLKPSVQMKLLHKIIHLPMLRFFFLKHH